MDDDGNFKIREDNAIIFKLEGLEGAVSTRLRSTIFRLRLEPSNLLEISQQDL